MTDPDRIQRDKATILAIIKYALFAVLAVAIVYYGFRLIWILFPFVIGFILAKVAGFLARKWMDMVYRIGLRRKRHAPGSLTAAEIRKQHFPRGLALSRREIKTALAFYTLEVIAVIALLVGVMIAGFNQLRSLAQFLPDFVSKSDLGTRLASLLRDLSEKLGGIFQADFLASINAELDALKQRLLEAVPEIASAILNGLAAIAGYMPIFFMIVIVIIMSGYYFIADSRRIFNFLRRNVISRKFRQTTIRLVDSLSSTLFRVIGGYLFLLILTFVEALAGLLIIGMPYAVIIAMLIAVVDFLPVLGIGVTLVPVSAYLFINDNVWGGVGALVLLALMSLSRRVIEPAILGNAMSLHPLATLAAMIIGIALYGIGGIILGPVILVIAKEVMSFYGFDKKIRKFVDEILAKVGPES